MPKIIYITGGVRSGKSSFARTLAENYVKVACIDTVTAVEAFKSRVLLPEHPHSHWDMFEQTTEIDKLILQGGYDIYLLDNVAAMLADWIYGSAVQKGDPPDKFREEVESSVLKAVQKLMLSSIVVRKDLLIVSCEAGLGLAAHYPSGVFFMNLCGKVNQMIAAEADEAYFVVSGIPVKLK